MLQGRRRKLELKRNTAGARATYLRVAGIVAATTGVAFNDIVAIERPGRPNRSRGNAVSFARQAAIYLTVVACNVRQGALARALGRPRVRVLWACRAAEDLREQAAIDELFERMERMCHAGNPQ